MSKYVIHYFGGNGRAAIARAILTYAKADWTNDILNRDEWPKIKKSGLCEYEQVPVLEVDGKKYAQSWAINLYLAKKFDLMGKDIEEDYQIHNVMNSHEDVSQAVMGIRRCTDESKKPEAIKAAKEKLSFFLGKLNERYKANGKGKYFLGDKFTLADIVLAVNYPNSCDMLGECPCAKVAPELGELIKRVKEGELKEFYEKFYIKPDQLK